MGDYIIVYYYSRKEQTWIAEVRDEYNKAVDSLRACSEEHIITQAKKLGRKYNALRISKLK